MQRWPASASVFFVRGNSQHNALRCQPAPLRIPPRFPPAAPPHPPGKPPFLLIRFPLPSVARLRGALLGGQRSRSACSARSLRSPLAPLSLAPLAGASGWRLVLLLRRVVTLLLVAPFGRTPPLRFALAVVAAARLAARRSCAVGRLRSLPACRSLPRPGLRRLRLRRCAPCPHRRLGLEAASVALSSGGAAAWLVRRSSFGGCSRVARLVLPRVTLSLRFRLRRALPAVAPSPPSLRFPASPWLSRCAPLPLAARFPPLRFGRSLAARSSCGGRALSPAAVVCRRSCAPHCARSSAPPTRAAPSPRAGK